MKNLMLGLLVSPMLAGMSVAEIVLGNEVMRLTLGEDARPRSLVMLANGEECLDNHEDLPFFTVTQERPFNNEIKLIHPHKRTVYPARRVRREGENLVVSFDIAPYDAVVKPIVGKGYLAFQLVDFRCTPASYPISPTCCRQLDMDAPPAVSLRLAQLPVRRRRNVGDWLNIVWDDSAAVAVVGCDPYAAIDHERRHGFELLYGDVTRGLKFRGGAVAIVAGVGSEGFLDSMDRLEVDFQLPRGVQSRRSPKLRRSIYWTDSISPTNFTEHVALAKSAGLSMLLINFPAFNGYRWYDVLGDYDWGADYPEGERTLAAMLAKIRAEGITCGFHTLQTHIGVNSRYVTPTLDPRLNKTRRFTLAKPIPASGAVTEIEVCENPVDAAMYPTVRVLGFGGEAFVYEGYTTTPPYRFHGVRRGHWRTRPVAHPRGEVGGTLDVSEFSARSIYIDQQTDLQDEVAKKIARIYDAGMEFCYFDGSEGVNPPCGLNVALSQYRVASAFRQFPLFTQGAAKSHFGWHLQAGANAFDIFPPETFKRSIAEYPLKEAPLMRQDLTGVDFGWWTVFVPGEAVEFLDGHEVRKQPTVGTQYDMWEYGLAHAAAWNCHTTIKLDPHYSRQHPRLPDLLEVLRRWESAVARNWFTAEQRERLKRADLEHHLYRNEKGELELHELKMLTADRPGLRAFVFERNGKRVIAYWHTASAGEYVLPLGDHGEPVKLAASALQYLETGLSLEDVQAAFRSLAL